VRVLAGDIGGTKTAIATVEVGSSKLRILRERRYPSAGYPGLEEIVEDFLKGGRRLPHAAAFGVAGPVRGGRAKVTKLPWVLDERRLARRLRIPRVRLLNDFAAAALGLPYLRPPQVAALAAGEEEPGGPIAILGAGTGLGQAALAWIGRRAWAFPSEGGHADFGPRDAREDRLVRFLRKRFGRVDRDRLLSGEGMGHLYDFLSSDEFAPPSRAVTRAMAAEDRAAVVTRFGLRGRDRLCSEALRMFVAIYGSEAGNLALQYRATGGVYLAGGIAPRILPALRRSDFMKAFRGKPPLEEFLARIPVRVVLEPRLPLFGAAAAAYMTLMERTRPSSKTTMRRTRS
jgi:glucokinase